MQITDKLFRVVVIMVSSAILMGCARSIITPGRYVYSGKPPTNKRAVVGLAYNIEILPDSTYRYEYMNVGNYREYSYGTWSITSTGRLMLWDALSTMTQIPIKVNESDNGDLSTTVFEFSPDLEPAFWNLVIDNTIYPIVGKRLSIPGELRADYFYLLGFNKKYEGINSPNEIVKTGEYYITDKKNHVFSIELPEYATNYEILFYKPMNTTGEFIIKKDKLIQASSKIELILSR